MRLASNSRWLSWMRFPADPELYERCLAAGSYPSPSSADGRHRQNGNLPLRANRKGRQSASMGDLMLADSANHYILQANLKEMLA
jgi:hypothetical protein